MKVEMPKLECKRCGKIWIPRKTEIRICPKCKSAWFDTPKEKKNDNKKG